MGVELIPGDTVLLVSLGAEPEFRQGPGLGIAYLGAALRASHVKVEVSSMEAGGPPDDANPFLVGVSVMFSAQLTEALQVVRDLKGRFPKAHLTIGGSGISFLWQELLEIEPNLDSAVCFEGEEIIVDLAKSLEHGASIENVSGIYWRDGMGRVQCNGYRDPPSNLDELPRPLRDSSYLIEGDRHLSLLTSRGCSAHCSFCQSGNYGNRYHGGPKWRARSPKDIIDEMRVLIEEYGVRDFSIVDDDFLGACQAGQERCKEFCEGLRSSGLNVNFSIECRAEEIAEEVFRDLVDVGLSHVFFGVESACDQELRLYGKRQTTDRCLEAMEVLRNLDIFFTVGFIMFQPSSSLQSVKTNLEFLRSQRLLTSGRLTNRLKLYQGGPLTSYFKRRGTRLRFSQFQYDYEFEEPLVRGVYEGFEKLAQSAARYESAIFRSIFSAQTRNDDWKAPMERLQIVSDILGDAAAKILDDRLKPEVAALACDRALQSI